MICEKLEPVFGTRLNEVENKKRGEELLISSEDSKVKIYVIPTNEEVMIARDTARLLNL
jgi:acetate kinase